MAKTITDCGGLKPPKLMPPKKDDGSKGTKKTPKSGKTK